MNEFYNYLLEKGEALNTIKARVNTVKNFIDWLDNQPIDYENLMRFIAFCQSCKNTPQTIRLKVANLRHYFDFLIQKGELKENPTYNLTIKGVTRKLPHRLLSNDELTEVYGLQASGGLTGKRDKVLLSLSIFQAVRSFELSNIELTDVDLMQGTIYIKGSRTTNERVLTLQAHQMLLIQDYLLNVRPEILRIAEKQSDYFLVNQGKGKGILSNVISVVLRRLRPQYPKLKSFEQLRQSRIQEWVNEHGLRKAQYYSGHRYVSSTERYNKNRMEGLKKELKMRYLLGK